MTPAHVQDSCADMEHRPDGSMPATDVGTEQAADIVLVGCGWGTADTRRSSGGDRAATTGATASSAVHADGGGAAASAPERQDAAGGGDDDEEVPTPPRGSNEDCFDRTVGPAKDGSSHRDASSAVHDDQDDASAAIDAVLQVKDGLACSHSQAATAGQAQDEAMTQGPAELSSHLHAISHRQALARLVKAEQEVAACKAALQTLSLSRPPCSSMPAPPHSMAGAFTTPQHPAPKASWLPTPPQLPLFTDVAIAQQCEWGASLQSGVDGGSSSFGELAAALEEAGRLGTHLETALVAAAEQREQHSVAPALAAARGLQQALRQAAAAARTARGAHCQLAEAHRQACTGATQLAACQQQLRALYQQVAEQTEALEGQLQLAQQQGLAAGAGGA